MNSVKRISVHFKSFVPIPIEELVYQKIKTKDQKVFRLYIALLHEENRLCVENLQRCNFIVT
jgi:hypothetical protein